MGQNIESTVNIKVTADTSQAVSELKNIANADFSSSIKEISNGYSAIDEILNQATNTTAKFYSELEKINNADLSNFGFNMNAVSEFENVFNNEEISTNLNTLENITNTADELGNNTAKASVNTEELINTIGGLIQGGKLSAGTFEKLASAIGMSGAELTAIGGAASIAIAAFKILNDNLKEIINGFVNAGKVIGEGAVDGIEWFIDSLKDMSDMLENAIDKLQEFSDYGIEIQNSYIGLGNFIGKEALSGLNEYADTLEKIFGLDATGVIADINKMSAALYSLGGTSEELENAGKNLYTMALDLHGLNSALTSTEKAISDINRAIEYGNISKRMESLYAMLGQDGVEAFNKLNTAQERYNFLMKQSISIQGAYQKYLETDAGKIEILNQQYSSLLGNIGQIALHLYATIAPVLTQILQLANGVLSSLMKLFNIDVRISTGAGGSSGLGGIKDKLDEITDSANKANKQLASFDDVIQINDNKSGGIADVGDLGGIEDFGNILGDLIDDSNDLTDIWAKFKRLIEDGDWLNAGKDFITVLAEQLNKIQWSDIKENATDAGKSISELINGLFNIDLDGFIAWSTIGTTVAEGLNTAISFADSTLSNISFVEIGKSLGNAWQALWNNLDTDSAAHALYEAFTGIFEFAIGWLQGGGLSKAATTFSEFIESLFGNFTESDIDNIVYVAEGIIDDIINALSITADALTSDKVKKVVFSLITKLVTAFKENASEWGSSLNDIAMDILNFIKEGIETADKAGLISAFTDFIYGLHLFDILSTYLSIKWKLFCIKVESKIAEFGSILLQRLIKVNLMLITPFIEFGIWIGQFLVKLVTNAKEGWSNIVEGIKNFGNNTWSVLTTIGNDIKSIFTSIWNFIKGIFNPENWANIAKNAINALWNGIKGVWNSTIGSWSINIPGIETLGWEGINISIPKLATGGIATRSVLANIGEAGEEAVLPLENNTAWMDKLATKIANQVGGSGNGGRIVVELSDKPLITRAEKYEFAALIVDSLKTYGVNIAIV